MLLYHEVKAQQERLEVDIRTKGHERSDARVVYKEQDVKAKTLVTRLRNWHQWYAAKLVTPH